MSEEINRVIETLKAINTEEGFYHAMASILTTLSKQVYGVQSIGSHSALKLTFS